MKIEIEIPEEFEVDYNSDLFRDFFSRVSFDIDGKGLCGKYELEIAEMFIDAFRKSKPACDVSKIVEELENLRRVNKKIQYERDLAIQQLKNLGGNLGEKSELIYQRIYNKAIDDFANELKEDFLNVEDLNLSYAFFAFLDRNSERLKEREKNDE